MPSFQILKPAARAVAALALLTCSIGTAVAASGKEIYQQQCIACHGAKGLGDGPHVTSLTSPPASFLDKAIKLSAEKAVMTGVNNAPGHSVGQLLTSREIEDLIEYVDGLAKGKVDAD